VERVAAASPVQLTGSLWLTCEQPEIIVWIKSGDACYTSAHK
jgi:hypothetical protein